MSGIIANPEFWVLIAALLLAAGLWRPVSRALLASLDNRAAAIGRELESARALRDDAESALAEYQKKQQEAEGEAERIIAHAKAEAERIAAQAERDLEASLARRQRLAEERIAQEEAKAVAEIRTAAVDIAVAAAREIIAGQLDETRSAALVDAAIGALPTQLH
jgi:F-type H+-transporting ATPase subunit b